MKVKTHKPRDRKSVFAKHSLRVLKKKEKFESNKISEISHIPIREKFPSKIVDSNP